MLYTVSDFLATHSGQVRIIAGSGGLSRPISEVGILDYELMPGLKEKFRRNNFYERQLVLSTFLYAKDDPYQIVEAVKYLVGKGTSGLVIKNVLRLPLSDAALRYADARNFPLMLVTSDEAFFDVLVGDVNARVRELASAEFSQHALDALWLAAGDSEKARATARQLCPSFREECMVLFARAEEPLSSESFEWLRRQWRQGPFGLPYSLATSYNGGFLAVVTADGDNAQLPSSAQLGEFALGELACEQEFREIGLSEPHYSLGELGIALHQALEAAEVAARRQETLCCFGHLGVLRAVLPFAEAPEMRSFAAGVFRPLQEFDAENNGALEETVRTWYRVGQSIEAAAEILGQHPNTVRYRFDQVRQLSSLDRRRPSEAQQLAFAAAIQEAQGIKEALRF